MTASVIRFRGHKLILVDGAITTADRFRSGAASLAHLKDNKVWCYGEIIADGSEIEVIQKDVPLPAPTKNAMMAILLGEWTSPTEIMANPFCRRGL